MLVPSHLMFMDIIRFVNFANIYVTHTYVCFLNTNTQHVFTCVCTKSMYT